MDVGPISSFFLLSEPENKSKNLVYTKGYGSLKMVNRFSKNNDASKIMGACE